MSNSLRLSLLGAVALLSAACSQPETPASDTPAPAVVEEAATAEVAPAPATPAPIEGFHAISADQLAEKRVNAPASCNIEAMDRNVFKSEPVKLVRGTVKVAGWFLSERTKTTGVPASIRIEDEAGTSGWELGIASWQPRADVLAAMKAVDSGSPGFREDLDLTQLAPGTYRLSVVFSDAGINYACNNNRVIVIE